MGKKKMSWWKFTKYFQGGSHEEWRLMDHAPEQCDMEEWGERTDGGHNYGYQVRVERGTPPKEVVEEKIKKLKEALERADADNEENKARLREKIKEMGG